MLRAELHILKQLIGQLIAELEKSVLVSSRVQLGSLHLLKEEADRLQNRWMRHLFSGMKEVSILRYVHFHQRGLTALSDQLSEKRSEIAVTSANMLPVEDALILLEDLLRFLQQAFPDSFDLDKPQSRYRRLQDQQAFALRLASLKEGFALHLPGSSLATTIMLALSERVADLPTEQISYQQSTVIEQVIHAFGSYVSGKTMISEKDLFLFAYKLNFNTKRLHNWFKESFRISPIFRVDEAYELFGNLRQFDRQPFDPLEPPIADTLLSWLGAGKGTEIHLRRSSGPEQLPLELSVAQFSLLIRICYRAGCFSLHNAAEIIRFFTAHFQTKRQDVLSVKSFTKGYYAMDQTAAAVIRDLLQRMVALINKTYFP